MEFLNILNVISDHSCLKYLRFLVWKWLDITTSIYVISCLQLSQWNYMIKEGLNKCFSAYKNLYLYKSISYTFFCTDLSKVKLEILRNSSTIFRSSHWRNFIKKLLLKILRYSRQNPCWSLSLMKLQAFRPGTLLKRNSNIDGFLWISQNC